MIKIRLSWRKRGVKRLLKRLCQFQTILRKQSQHTLQNRALVSSADNHVSTTVLHEAELESNLRKYLQMISKIEHELNESKLKMQDVEELKMKVMQYWEAAEKDWVKQKIHVMEVGNLKDMFKNLYLTLDKRERERYREMTEQKKVNEV